MERIELEAGSNQRIVVYVSRDDGDAPDPVPLWEEIARDAASVEREGWAIVSTAVMPMRQMGTAGNWLFQSGGQYVTQVAIAVTYRLA